MTILVLPSNSATGYNLTKSLRFRSSASASLTRTVTGVNTTQLTFSFWLKYSVNPSDNVIYATSNNSSNYLYIGFNSSYVLDVQIGATANRRVTTQVFRDPSAWYHIVVTFDTTQATASDRIKIYVNGSQVTAFSTNTTGMSQNSNLPSISSTLTNYIGNYNGSAGFYYDGYMAELNAVYGQALTPSSFGSTNSQTGVWQPARYTGTYGTNGFYLPFTNTTSTSTLGNDFSGNNNTWTVNNISLTSGSTYDSMNDVPTLTDATTANYPVWNPINNLPSATNTTAVISNGNLQLTSSASEGNGNSSAIGTMQIPSTGKWYWEVTITGRATLAASRSQIGIVKASAFYTNSADVAYNTTSNACYVYAGSGDKAVSYGNFSAYGSAWTNGDVIGVACDWDAGTLTFYKNGTSQGTAFSSLSGSDNYFPIAGYFGTYNINFGQRPFAYPLTGFKALNTFNLSTPTIGATASSQANKYFDVSLYTANGSTNVITNTAGFKPDFVWTKSRATAASWLQYDSVRGVNNALSSNSSAAEATSTGLLTSFNSNGFTLGANDNSNTSGYGNAVGFQWQAGQGTTSSNTNGSITSTVSVNTTAGFSIVTYTGNGSNSTIGHGLGVAPSFIIAKARNSAQRWTVYTAALGNGYYGYLNETFAFDTANASLRWNTAPTSSVFGVGTSVDVNNNTTTYVAYCFAEIAGYSKFGSYTGNGSSDGPFVFTGFRPRYIMIKPSNVSGEYWQIIDTSRNPYNASPANMLSANLSAAESGISSQTTDILSNGFKLRGSGGGTNGSGTNYIYMAFAESPFKYANAR